ncbi:MAG: molybdopterin-binding/glycosyltransferase family 2 protein [Rhodospirillaceae bacterium]|nr:molybdopterin-binding/glycosyltransferase family 2 protein [Rhodospirillaceae bacterium]
MKFGPVPLGEARGAILAHSLKIGSGRIAKGRVLDEADIAALRNASFETVTVARLGPRDLDEDTAATRIAESLEPDTLRFGPAGKGRCNLYARNPGLVLVDADRIAAANQIEESLTLATLRPLTAVVANQLVATVKIITFGAASDQVEAVATAARGAVSVARYRPRDAALIQTRLPDMPDRLLDKTKRATADRLRAVAAALRHTTVTDHDSATLAATIKEAAAAHALIIVIGASAITDRRDVVPKAVQEAGGEILHFGLPVDPGNLTLLAHLDGSMVVAMPGSARSPREQGSDWVLQRLAADLPVDSATLAGFGVGGLLKEIRSRPMPRDHEKEERPAPQRPVDAVLLAAGQSRRMGSRNKLLESIGGRAMIRRVCETIELSGIRRLIVVTGHEAEAVSEALSGTASRFVHNPDYAAGMGSSIAAGVHAAYDSMDPPEAIIICLGDMPEVTANMIDRLIENYDADAGRTIVVATYRGQRGNPVLWDHRFADDLANLSGDKGGRDILNEHGEHVITVDLDDAAVLRDVDTPEALDACRRMTREKPVP